MTFGLSYKVSNHLIETLAQVRHNSEKKKKNLKVWLSFNCCGNKSKQKQISSWWWGWILGSVGQTPGCSSSRLVHQENLSWEPVNPRVHQMSPSTSRVYSELHQLFANVAHFLYLFKAAVVLDEVSGFSWTFAEDHSARRHTVSSLNHRCLHLESVMQISSLFFCEWVKWHDTRSSRVYWGPWSQQPFPHPQTEAPICSRLENPTDSFWHIYMNHYYY